MVCLVIKQFFLEIGQIYHQSTKFLSTFWTKNRAILENDQYFLQIFYPYCVDQFDVDTAFRVLNRLIVRRLIEKCLIDGRLINFSNSNIFSGSDKMAQNAALGQAKFYLRWQAAAAAVCTLAPQQRSAEVHDSNSSGIMYLGTSLLRHQGKRLKFLFYLGACVLWQTKFSLQQQASAATSRRPQSRGRRGIWLSYCNL